MLTKGRNTTEFADGRTLVLPVKAGAKIFDGALVALDATGYAIAGDVAVGLLAAGRAEEFVDNTSGADGDVTVRVRRGVFKWANDTVGPVTSEDLLKPCYILDDETVTITATGASVAGTIIGIEDGEVIVETL